MAQHLTRLLLGSLQAGATLPAAFDFSSSSCYIHWEASFPAGLDDAWRKLCKVAEFAVVHNCSVIASPPSEHMLAVHNGGELDETATWSRYRDLQSNRKLPGSRAIVEESEAVGFLANAPLNGWLWRNYHGAHGLLEIVRKLQLDLRESDYGPGRIYSLEITTNFWGGKSEQLGMLTPSKFLHESMEAAGRMGITARRDLLEGYKGPGPSLIEIRRDPCGQGFSQELRRYVASQKRNVLGGKRFVHLRIRRGDYLQRDDLVDTAQYVPCVTAENVARVFLKTLKSRLPKYPRTLLVHSNEKDESYWRELKERMGGAFDKIITERELSSWYPHDNYFAYAASQLFDKEAAFALRFHPSTMGHLCRKPKAP